MPGTSSIKKLIDNLKKDIECHRADIDKTKQMIERLEKHEKERKAGKVQKDQARQNTG